MKTMKTRRTIKFRGLAPSGWHWGSLYVNDEGDTFIDKADWRREPVVPNTVGQFTGLTDKNGVEIYEGDILSQDGLRAVVEFIGVEFCAMADLPEPDCVTNLLYESSEIIGNIWDNPELLEEVAHH